MQFELQLLEEKVKKHQITTLHMICCLAFILAGAIIYVYNHTIPMWGGILLGVGVTIMLLTLFKNKWVTTVPGNYVFRAIELIISLTLLGYSLLEMWKLPIGIFGILSAVLLFALYWERAANKTQYVLINADGIFLPISSRRRHIPWTDAESVILKFGTLSIDCTDNHRYQWNVIIKNVDTTAVEAYSSQLIEENIAKRQKDDW